MKKNQYSIETHKPKCICCKSEIVFHIPFEGYTKDILSQNVEGIVSEIAAGYGSDFDGDVLIIGICDKCIRKGYEEGSLLFSHNYLNIPWAGKN